MLKRIVCPYCSSDKFDELFILTGSPAFNTLYDTFDTYNNTFDSSKYTEKIESPFYLFNNKSCQITLYWLNPDTKSFENLFSVNHVIIDGSDKINLSGDYKILDKSDDEDGLRYELDLFAKISHPAWETIK